MSSGAVRVIYLWSPVLHVRNKIQNSIFIFLFSDLTNFTDPNLMKNFRRSLRSVMTGQTFSLQQIIKFFISGLHDPLLLLLHIVA